MTKMIYLMEKKKPSQLIGQAQPRLIDTMIIYRHILAAASAPYPITTTSKVLMTKLIIDDMEMDT